MHAVDPKRRAGRMAQGRLAESIQAIGGKLNHSAR
jgi:hypothetical protein